MRGLISSGLVAGVHDLSDGGLLVAAADIALASKVGVTLNATSQAHAHPYLLGEDQARYLIATPDPDAVLEAAKGGWRSTPSSPAWPAGRPSPPRTCSASRWTPCARRTKPGCRAT
ncbi:AIR synthase-related protein [Caulobacter segnis]